MGHRLSKIYTRTGDAGETGLADGSRIAKTDPRVDAMGDVDELNCVIGALRACALPEPVDAELSEIQHDLFDLGGELSIPGYELVRLEQINLIEAAIDRLNEDLPPLKEFVLPGGNEPAALCHLARAVCRRAERAIARVDNPPANTISASYINRLSDYLFVAARSLARQNGGREVQWARQREG
ncbi:MAG: cob(I)yrinic acid a,c-diamide adenosyltransferase [Pseudomonadota bacterium]